MPHTYECPVRWADMDMLGHVNNAAYLDYVAEARENLFPDSCPFSLDKIEEESFWPL